MPELTPLAAKLIARIRADGPIPVSEYMAACLADPQHGYYSRHDPLGRGGDFITAPEISQIFGELIGLWCVSVWQAMGSPPRFVLAEVGPGRGTLMADALRAARIRPAFAEAAELALVEINEGLRAAQKQALAGLAEPVWVDSPDALPPGPIIVIANEFFDALPIRQFVRTDDGWAERMVGLDGDGRLAFGLRPVEGSDVDMRFASQHSRISPARTRVFPSSTPLSDQVGKIRLGSGETAEPDLRSKSLAKREGGDTTNSGDRNPTFPQPPPETARFARGFRPPHKGEVRTEYDAPPGTIVETSPAAETIASQLAERIARDGGAALVIDYGYATPGTGDTLQAIRAHAFDDPLAHPGAADLTAHVNFATLARAAAKGSAVARPVMDQRTFLSALGIASRAEALSRGKSEAIRADIAGAVARLTGDDQMGRLFKVLAFASKGLTLPAFDRTA